MADHADSAQGARGGMHKGGVLPDGLHTTYHRNHETRSATRWRTIGAHTWSHAHLDGKKLTGSRPRTIEKGLRGPGRSAQRRNRQFFRFRRSPMHERRIGLSQRRNIAIAIVDVGPASEFSSVKPAVIRP